ncbi:hypothetical protein GCM10028821_14380 [Hymenobacter jeollabukensis]
MAEIESSLDHSSAERLAELLMAAEDWCIFRVDKKGTHVHLAGPESILLVGDFFAGAPDIRKVVMDYVRAKTKQPGSK